MAKSIRWSKSLTFLWEQFHQYLNLANGDIKRASQLFIQNIRYQSLDKNEEIRNFQNLRLLACDLDHRMLHFYFSEQLLYEYLKDMELKRFDDVRSVVKAKGAHFLGRMFNKDGTHSKQEILEIGFTIDIPYKKYGYAFLVHITKDDKIEISCSYDYSKFITVHEYHYLSYLKKKDKNPEVEKVMQLFRLAINTIFYIDHYPELVMAGVPKQLEKTEYNEVSFQVGTCEIFKEVEARKKQGYIVKPHARCGYWKVLRSDYYTPEKRGTSIHISPTMVKGNSSTVLTHKNIKNGKGLVEEVIKTD